MAAWARNTFIDADAPLVNPDHEHLREATVMVAWTARPGRMTGRNILGQCEMLQHGAKNWRKGWSSSLALMWAEAEGWEDEPDFLILLSAPWFATCSDLEACAVIEHELYHCGQQMDEFGEPRFSQSTGLPLWCVRGHDVEEFVGVARRYGAYSGELREIHAALGAEPEIGPVEIEGACGTCGRIAA